MKKTNIFAFLVISIFLVFGFIVPPKKSVKIFNGTDLKGWQGETTKTWQVVNGSIVGGSLVETVPNNEFLTTEKSYSSFQLKLKFKLENAGGFMNAGIQFRSQRLTKPAYEMTGYQADLGPNYWGSLYDESRRNKVLIAADSTIIKKILKPSQWNDYEIIAQKNHIQLKINGVKTIDYFEKDMAIPQFGLIGLQVHGGGKTKVSYKDIWIKEL